jgi:hypothetical protein
MHLCLISINSANLLIRMEHGLSYRSSQLNLGMLKRWQWISNLNIDLRIIFFICIMKWILRRNQSLFLINCSLLNLTQTLLLSTLIGSKIIQKERAIYQLKTKNLSNKSSYYRFKYASTFQKDSHLEFTTFILA